MIYIFAVDFLFSSGHIPYQTHIYVHIVWWLLQTPDQRVFHFIVRKLARIRSFANHNYIHINEHIQFVLVNSNGTMCCLQPQCSWPFHVDDFEKLKLFSIYLPFFHSSFWLRFVAKFHDSIICILNTRFNSAPVHNLPGGYSNSNKKKSFIHNLIWRGFF